MSSLPEAVSDFAAARAEDDPFVYRSLSALQGSRPRILFIVSPAWLPQSTGGGSPMIAFSLERTFSRLGWEVAFLGLFKPERWPGVDVARKMIADAGQQTKYWFAMRGPWLHEVSVIRQVLAETNPDLVYCYGSVAAARVRAAGTNAPVVVTFYDPPGVNGVYKRLAQIRYGIFSEKLRALRSLPRSLKQSWSMRASDRADMAKADVIVSHSYNHGREYAEKLSRAVEYFPNPLAVTERPDRSGVKRPPVFLMAGHVTSTVSLTGYYFFCDRVLPHLKPALQRGDFTIRIVGGGNLPERLGKALAAVSGIKNLGRVSEDELKAQYAKATALLVPTPIPLGFRTRIIDAFRYGLPTIVHSANQAGFRELESGKNCLMTADGRRFARFMIDAAHDPASLDCIGQTARREFEELYSAEVFSNFIVGRAMRHKVSEKP